MALGNGDIEGNIMVLVGAYLKGQRVKPEDEVAIKAGVALAVNLLQNINDIAYCAVNADQRAYDDR